jgi:DNA-binding SARP family transcriptional activator
LRFNVLGSLEVIDGGQQLPLGGIKQRAALGYLLLHANKVVSTNQLLKALWTDEAPLTARKVLHNAISRLRSVLSVDAETDSPLSTQPPGYVLRIDPARFDLPCFRALVERGRADLTAGSWTSASDLLSGALTLWRGPVMADLTEAGLAWPELVALENERSAALGDYIKAELALGRHQQVAAELEPLVETEPLRERLSGQLMLALYRCGRQGDALRVYRRTRTALVEQLGLDPSQELQNLERAILRHDEALDLPVAVTTARTTAPTTEADPSDEVLTERKQISVVAVDIVGQDADPRGNDVGSPREPEDFDVLSAALTTALDEELGHFGGVVTGTVGLMSLAIFGAPAAHEDDASRAVRAALAIRDRVDSLWPVVAGTGIRNRFGTRIAVATGEAGVTRRQAAPDVLSKVTGAVLDSCMKLLAQVPPGAIHACEATRDASEHAIRYRRPAGPAIGYEVAGILAEPEPSDRHHPEAPLIGRDCELEFLRAALRRAGRRRQPQFVTVLGDAGAGKSRLIAEFRRDIEDSPWPARLIQTGTPRFGPDRTRSALGGIVRSYARITTRDTPSVAGQKLANSLRLTGDGGDADWMSPHLEALIDSTDRVLPEERVRQASHACRRLVQDAACEGPLVLVVEDLHFADDRLLDFVHDLAELARSTPLVVVGTARPDLLERRPDWGGGKHDASTITLDPLSSDAISQLLRSHLAGSPATEKVPTLVDRVGGNPLFAIEYARTLRSEGTDAVAAHGHRATPRGAIPPAIQRVIAAQLDTLPIPAKAVLQDIAVLGNHVPIEAVAAVGDRAWSETARWLTYLERRMLIRRTSRKRMQDAAEYVSEQPLVQAVAYAQLPREVRADKHRRAAAWREAARQGVPAPPVSHGVLVPRGEQSTATAPLALAG